VASSASPESKNNEAFGEAFDLRSSARYLYAAKALAVAEHLEGAGDTLFVTRPGLLLAYDILAVCSKAAGST
jgi:hypothetical protein